DQSVDQSAPGYTGSGDSWTDALPELADALQRARQQHDADTDWLHNDSLRIYIAKGTYLRQYKPAEEESNENPPTHRDKTFLMVKNVQLYGGFDPENGIETLNDDRILPDNAEEGEGTILSGDLDTPDDNSDNAYHVLLSSGDAGVA